MDCGVMSDTRIFDVAKGVLIATRRCSVNDAFAELVAVAERHHLGALAVARALVGLASEGLTQDSTDEAAVAAAASAWGYLFTISG